MNKAVNKVDEREGGALKLYSFFFYLYSIPSFKLQVNIKLHKKNKMTELNYRINKMYNLCIVHTQHGTKYITYYAMPFLSNLKLKTKEEI